MLMLLTQKLKTWPQLLILSILLCVAQTAPVLAAGDATFSLFPSGGSYTVGNTFTVTVSETSAAADNTLGAQANLSYNSSLLQWEGNSLGVFNTICGANTGGGGSVSIACAQTNPVGGGTQTVAAITFKVLASGTTSVSMVPGPGGTPTDIQNSSGSVWSGNLPVANFSLANAPVSSGSSGSSKPASTSTPRSTSSTAPKPATTTPTTATTAQPKTTTKPPVLSYVTIIVTDTAGQPIKGAKVVLDGNYVVYSDSQGKANFTTENAGSHSVTITDPGKKPYQTKVTLTAGQSIPIELQLTSAQSNSWLYIVLGIILALIAVGVILWFLKPSWLRLPWGRKPVAFSPAVVSSIDNQPVHPNPAQSPLPGWPHDKPGTPTQQDSFDGMRRKF